MATYLLLATLVYTAYMHAPFAEAAFYNDSDVIGIEGAPPPEPEENPDDGEGAGAGGSEEGGGSSSSGGFGTPGGSTGGASSGGSAGTGTGSGTGTGIDAGGAPAAGGDGEDEMSDTEDLFEQLLDQGVLNGAGISSGSTFFEDSSASLGGGSLAGEVSVNGEGVRAFFRGKYDLQDLLKTWRSGKEGRLNARGLGLVAASTALSDRNIATVSFTADTFEIKYRSRGYLFSIIPLTFPVRIIIIPEASASRVTVRLPWYRFFVREFFTAQSLAGEIDAVVQAQVDRNTDPNADLREALFSAVAQFLRKKIGTIADTVNLGASAQ